jgi:hypothetical protein
VLPISITFRLRALLQQHPERASVYGDVCFNRTKRSSGAPRLS